jgi:hypothetical protein
MKNSNKFFVSIIFLSLALQAKAQEKSTYVESEFFRLIATPSISDTLELTNDNDFKPEDPGILKFKDRERLLYSPEDQDKIFRTYLTIKTQSWYQCPRYIFNLAMRMETDLLNIFRINSECTLLPNLSDITVRIPLLLTFYKNRPTYSLEIANVVFTFTRNVDNSVSMTSEEKPSPPRRGSWAY